MSDQFIQLKHAAKDLKSLLFKYQQAANSPFLMRWSPYDFLTRCADGANRLQAASKALGDCIADRERDRWVRPLCVASLDLGADALNLIEDMCSVTDIYAPFPAADYEPLRRELSKLCDAMELHGRFELRLDINDLKSAIPRLRAEMSAQPAVPGESAPPSGIALPSPTEADDYRTARWFDEHYDIGADAIRKAAERGHVGRRGPKGKPRYSVRDMQRYFDAEMLGADGEDSGQIRTERTKPDKQEKPIESIGPRVH